MDERLVTGTGAVLISLERQLGDPFDASSPCSFRRIVDFDEAEEFPTPLCARAFESGVQDYFVPTGAGGKLVTCEEALALLRLLARRDLTVAIALGSTFLGAVHGWLAGSAAQKARLATLIAERKFISFALSERLHGSDVLSGEVVAHPTDGGYVLSGEKWSINNATQSAALLVFAKTQAAGGSRGFTLLLVDKERLPPAAYRYLPKIPTLGIRGADISGIAFDDAFVPADAVIGGQGAGLEIALKGLMVTRTLCAGLSLGAADTALRTTLRFAVERRLYGRTVFEIPAAKRAVVAAFADLLLCDCLALTGARALHVMPDQASLWSAVIKYLVPTIVEGSLRDLAAVLGARYYMRREFADGIFQKMLRDNLVVGLFDGSTAVNLHSLATQLPSLKAAGTLRSGAADALGARLRSAFTVDAPLPPFETLRLSLVARGVNDIQAAAALLPDALRDSAGDRRARYEAAALLQQIVDALAADQQRWPATPRDSVELFEAARRYCVYHAAVACAQFWLYSREALEPFYREPHWLNVSLSRLSTMVGGVPTVHSTSWEALAAQLLALFEENRLFSIRPHPLAPIRD